jgi:hypothetical protein
MTALEAVKVVQHLGSAIDEANAACDRLEDLASEIRKATRKLSDVKGEIQFALDQSEAKEASRVRTR